MKLKKSYKILMAFCSVLLCAVIFTDINLVKLISTVGGGFLDNSLKSIAYIGGGYMEDAIHIVPFIG